MKTEMKPIVSKEETFDRLEMRLGRITTVERADNSPKPAYAIKVDFGNFGVRTSVGRFTQHAPEELAGRLVVGVLNFEKRNVGGIVSESLCLGVQYPAADSGEATIITPLVEAKIGGKLF